MGWRDLVEDTPVSVVLPWLGGRELRHGARRWALAGRLPVEHGWTTFLARGRTARWAFDVDGTSVTVYEPRKLLTGIVRGIPIGDRFVPDEARGVLHMMARARGPVTAQMQETVLDIFEPVHLLDTGLERFGAVYAGRAFEGGPLVFMEQALPDEAAPGVARAWEDGKRTLDEVPAVTPALDLAFRLLWAQRDEADRARAEIERQRKLEELARAGGTAVGRRQLAVEDFAQAARMALAAGQAEYLDHQPGAKPTEMVVRFRAEAMRFECVVDRLALSVVDAGICLQDHRTGRRDDKLLSLESLPSVIREAIRTGRLHVYRPIDPPHVYQQQGEREDWDD